MARRRPSTRPLLALIAAGALLLVGCGGGSGDGSEATPSTEAPTTTAASTTTEATTTTTEVPKADQATAEEAASRLFQLADLPEGWTVATEAIDYQGKGIAVDPCLNPEDGLLAALPRGAQAAGPTLQPPDVPYFVTTWAATFATEEDASAWAATLDTPEHAACQGEAFEAADQEGRTVRQQPEPDGGDPIGQGGLVASDAYDYVDGEDVVSTLYVQAYRVGRTVLTVTTQLGPMEQAQAEAANDAAYGALTAVLAR